MKQILEKRSISRIAAVLLCLVLLLPAGLTTAFAYGSVDTKASASMTVNFTDNSKGIEGASFRLYRVADVSEAVAFTLTGDFTGASVSLNDVKNSSGWSDIAATLESYVAANKISPVKTGVTDKNGTVSFTGLPVGLYLLLGDNTVVGDYSYTPAASVIMLPTLLDNDTWNYNPTVDIKSTKKPVTKTQELSVKKVWKDNNYDKRPTSVEIQLLRDGEVQDTVTLDADNNWTYTWKDLTSIYVDDNGNKKTFTYTVNEKNVPSGYTASVSQNDTAYTVTNTKKDTPTTPDNKKNPTDETLPKTGQLNWPIPILTISGLLLVGLGWYLFNCKREH